MQFERYLRAKVKLSHERFITNTVKIFRYMPFIQTRGGNDFLFLKQRQVQK